jgi:O-acetyl-ADP-ribose deacetylase (regulator of RNase III)
MIESDYNQAGGENMNTIHAKLTFPSGQRLEIVQGDITEEPVDAIVNAANSHLQHGAGVAGAIVRKGGYEIQRESNEWVHLHGPVKHDQPAYTGPGRLPCRYVIHAVGPVWGEGDEEARLASAVEGSLRLAEQLGLSSIAFPAISTGIFGFPRELAAQIFMQVIRDHFAEKPESALSLVRLTLYDNPTLETFLAAAGDEDPKD